MTGIGIHQFIFFCLLSKPKNYQDALIFVISIEAIPSSINMTLISITTFRLHGCQVLLKH